MKNGDSSVKYRRNAENISKQQYWLEILFCSKVRQKFYLNILFELQQRSFHNVSQKESLILHIKGVSSNISYSLPMASHHSFVSHLLQQGTSLIEVINSLTQLLKRLPLFQSFW